MISVLRPPSRAWPAGLALAALLAVGCIGTYRYLANYWTYRGFAPPRDAAFVKVHGTTARFYVASAALGGRRQPVDVFLPPGYATHPGRRYPVLYLLHGVPGRPGAFLATVRMGVVQDELVALHRARPMILVMPFGSTGSFTDEEWANGVGARLCVGDLPRARRRAPGRRALQDDPPRQRTGAGGALRGRLRRAEHRHPPSGRVPGARELVRLPARRRHRLDLRPSRRACCAATARRRRSRASAAALRRAHTTIWFYSGTGDRELAQNRSFAQQLTSLGLRHRFFVVRGGHNWALWRGNAARAYLAASRGLRGA